MHVYGLKMMSENIQYKDMEIIVHSPSRETQFMAKDTPDYWLNKPKPNQNSVLIYLIPFHTAIVFTTNENFSISLYG